jgi:hypothetical protein
VPTGTLIICVGATPNSFTVSTDASGDFSVATGLPDGTYGWRFKGHRHLANSGTLTIAGGTVTQEFGLMRAGDVVQNNNLINANDFNTLKNQFGQPGNADLNYDGVVNAGDFNTLKGNFGQAGSALTCP